MGLQLVAQSDAQDSPFQLRLHKSAWQPRQPLKILSVCFDYVSLDGVGLPKTATSALSFTGTRSLRSFCQFKPEAL